MFTIFTSALAVIIVAAALLFSLLAYSREENKEIFFWFGAGFAALITIGILLNAEFYYYMVAEFQHPQSMMVIFGWIISIIFLILSKSNKSPNDDKVTDAFLDDVINSDDEVWDPES